MAGVGQCHSRPSTHGSSGKRVEWTQPRSAGCLLLLLAEATTARRHQPGLRVLPDCDSSDRPVAVREAGHCRYEQGHGLQLRAFDPGPPSAHGISLYSPSE